MPPPQNLVDWTISFAGGYGNTPEAMVTTTPIRGALNAPYPLLTTASPTYGVGPAPVIAADNTAGSFSVTKGNLYVAFVTRLPDHECANSCEIRLTRLLSPAMTVGVTKVSLGFSMPPNGKLGGRISRS